MSKIISGSQIGSANRMHVISRANFLPSLSILPFVTRVDMVADIERTPRRDVAENSLVGGKIGFCLIRQSSASPIVCVCQSNQVSGPHCIGMPRRVLGW